MTQELLEVLARCLTNDRAGYEAFKRGFEKGAAWYEQTVRDGDEDKEED